MSSSDRDRWQRLDDIFQAALDVAPEERAAHLDAACGSDAAPSAVRDALSSFADSATVFSDDGGSDDGLSDDGSTRSDRDPSGGSPRDDLAAPRLVTPGDVLAGRFRVLRFLAAGGMGEVYEAEDTELGQRVAVKTLRPEIAAAATS